MRRQIENRVDGALEMLVVARKRGFQKRQLQVEMGGAVYQRAQVLRQAGSSKGESWLQISRRAVELDVPAQRGHHLAAVHTYLVAERPDFIGKGDFHGMKCIARVFDHLGRTQRYDSGIRAKRPVQIGDRLRRRRIVGANHQKRGLEEIPNRRAFTQKLGMRHNAYREVVRKGRQHQLLASARKNSTPNPNNEPLPAWRKMPGDFGNRSLQLDQSQVAVPFRRRTHTNQYDVRFGDGARRGGY